MRALTQFAGSSSESSGNFGGGMLGGVTSATGQSGGALAALQGSGLSASQAGPFVKMVADYARQKAGPETVERVLDKVPALKAICNCATAGQLGREASSDL